MRPSLWSLSLAAPLLAAAACAGSPPATPPSRPAGTASATPLAALEAQHAAWRGRRLGGYAYLYRADCFCIGGGRWYRAVVRGGRVVEAAPRDPAAGGKGPPLAPEALPTVDSLFAIARRAFTEGADSVAVDYDAAGHYPRRLFMDWRRTAADDETTYLVDSLSAP
jgi:hypothetical protein